MANQGGTKAKAVVTERPEKGSDTINFTYSAAVEAALEKLESPRNDVIPITNRPPKKTVNRRIPPLREERDDKPKPDVVINKLDEIYSDWVFLRELNTPRNPEDPPPKTAIPNNQDNNAEKGGDAPEKTHGASNNDDEKNRNGAEKGEAKQRRDIPERTDTRQKKREGKPIEKLKKERDKE